MEIVLAHPWLIQVAVFGCFFCGALMLSAWLLPSTARTSSRLEKLMGDDPRTASPLRQILGQYFSQDSNWKWMEKILPDNDRLRSRVTQRLIVAGFYREAAVAQFMFLKLVCMISPLAIGGLVGWLSPLELHWCLMAGSLTGFVGLLVPGLCLTWITRARQRKLREALPDFVDLVVTCLEGGMGFNESLAQVNGELTDTHPVLCIELEYLMRDVHLGESLPQAFQRMWNRTNVDEVRTISGFIDQAHKFGSAMGEALRELSDMLRFQREQRAEELAQQAAVKILIPTLLFIFPTIFVVLAGPAAIQINESFVEQKEIQPTKARARR